MKREQPKRAGLAVGLQISPADDPVAAQQRQHVVAVDPLLRRLIDLHDVLEAE
jgi:hypothetical protein